MTSVSNPCVGVSMVTKGSGDSLPEKILKLLENAAFW